MPFLDIKTNIKITKEQKDIVRKAMGELLPVIPKEKGEYLMLNFEDECPLSFGGDCNCPCVAAELKILEKLIIIYDSEMIENFLRGATQILCTVLNINPENIFMLCTGVPIWACNGENIEKTIVKLY